MKYCTHCGAERRGVAQYCATCGTQHRDVRRRGARQCASCGTSLRAGARHCTQCGTTVATATVSKATAQTPPPAPASSQSAPTTGLGSRLPLALLTFAAAFTVHFYLIGVLNDGIYPDKVSSSGLLTNVTFKIPGLKDVEDVDTRQTLQNVQSYVAPYVDPVLPYTGYLLNWKDQSTYRASFALSSKAANVAPPMTTRISAAFLNGNFKSAFAIWTVGSLLGWSVFRSVLRRGPLRGVATVAKQPLGCLGWVLQSRGRDWGSLLFGGALAALANTTLAFRPEATLTMATAGLFMTASPAGAGLAQRLFRLVPAGWKGARSRSRFSLRSAHLLLAGMPFGLLGDRFLGVGGTPLVYGLLVAGAAVYLSPRLRRFFALLPLGGVGLWFAAAFAVWARSETLFPTLLAHDGGQLEFSGSFTEWIQSEGGVETAIHSAAGTAGTALGALAGSALEPRRLPDESQQKNQITSVEVNVSEARFEG